jgi:hypothetical protein
LGIALVVLPGPAFLVIPAGLAILAIEFAWARRWLGRARVRLPGKSRRLSVTKKNAACEANVPVGGSPTAVEESTLTTEALSRFEGEGGPEAPEPTEARAGPKGGPACWVVEDRVVGAGCSVRCS